MLSTLSTFLNMRVDKPTRLITHREKMFHSVICALFVFALSFVPLVGDYSYHKQTHVHFKVPGTCMALGLQPFVLVSIFVRKAKKYDETLTLGFLFSILQIVFLYRFSVATLQLIAVSWLCMQIMNWMQWRAKLALPTGLMLLHGCSLFLRPSIQCLNSMIAVTVLLYLNECKVPVPISHQKVKHRPIGANISIMYNGMSALVHYYMAIELLEWFGILSGTFHASYMSIPAAFGFIYVFHLYWHRFKKRSGKDLILAWKKQGYSIKGWHSVDRQAKYVENIIVQCVQQNTLILCCIFMTSLVVGMSCPLPALAVIFNFIEQMSASTLSKFQQTR